MKKNVKLFISGHFGESNMGDDLLLIGFINGLKKHLTNNFQLFIETANPITTKKLLIRENISLSNFEFLYNGRWGINNKPLFWIKNLKFLKKSDYVIIGPGNIINDTNFLFIPFWFIRFFIGKVLHKKVILCCIGVGNINKKSSILLIKLMVNFSQFISVRDNFSLIKLKKITKKSNIRCFPDLSFLTI